MSTQPGPGPSSPPQLAYYTVRPLPEVADIQNQQLQQDIDQLTHLLTDALGVDAFVDLQARKGPPHILPFDPGNLRHTRPQPSEYMYMPVEPPGLQKLLPWVRGRYEREVAEARMRYQADVDAYNRWEADRQQQLAAARTDYDHRVAIEHAKLDKLQRELAAGKREAVERYFTLVLEASSYPEDFPQQVRVAYVSESKQLVIEYQLPSFEVVPETASYKYVRTRNEITTSARPMAQRKTLYASVIAQVALRTLYEVFVADRAKQIETVVFNGMVDSVDRATGRAVRPCLITVRTSRETFLQLDLSKVDPALCLKALHAGVSKSPAELLPVRPVLEFNMVDPRFIQETDVLSTLDQRPNLLALTPGEFEALISNLFQAMGLETRLTQASRDGGVDCVAYDTRSILGGKVVIQAKRYLHTVGVSAVRDLYGTVHAEGATKGILVSTSGYGKAAYDFANGKPLELISGSHLLSLLAEHAGVEAKIEAPETWVEPQEEATSTT